MGRRQGWPKILSGERLVFSTMLLSGRAEELRSLLSKRQQRDITQERTRGGILEPVCGERRRDGGRRML